MKKSFFSTALLAAGLALSTFANAGEIADRVEQTKTLLVGTEGTYCLLYTSLMVPLVFCASVN